jgi:N-acetylmuramoyl-L-alanine amidase
MRNVHWIIIHQSASNRPEHDNIKTIRDWHLARNFSEIGYHFVIDSKGIVHKGRDEDKKGAHIQGHNSGSLGICLLGLFNKNNPPNEKQLNALEILLIEKCSQYGLEKKDILGHNDLAATECPGFDLHGWLASRGWH